MKIIIAGGGAVGFHLASLLAKENQDITVIDTDEKRISQIGRNLDVLTMRGDAANFETLSEAKINKAQLFISVTASEDTNLLSAILAKKLGAKRTVARISNIEHLEESNRQKYKELGVDVLISPQKLAALEIDRLLHRASFTDLFEFENGKISILGFTVDSQSLVKNRTLSEIGGMTGDFHLKGIALLRGQTTIIPDEDTVVREGDHLYISVDSKSIGAARAFAGTQLKSVRDVMIVGDTNLALRTAQELETKYDVKVMVEDEDAAKEFVRQLKHALVINVESGDIEALKEEGLSEMDAFIALTPNSESNIINSLMAQDQGVMKTISLVENVNYTHISQNIGIDTIINKKLIAANNIFRFVRKGQIEAIASLHGVEAEIIEFTVHKRTRICNTSIRDLRFPKSSVIAGVVRGDESHFPDEDFKFEKNDKVIILALPEAITKVEKIFK